MVVYHFLGAVVPLCSLYPISAGIVVETGYRLFITSLGWPIPLTSDLCVHPVANCNLAGTVGL